VVGRDIVIVAGAIAYHNLVGRIDAQPTRLSKLNTCVQIVYVVMQLVNLTSWVEFPHALMTTAIFVTAALAIVSGLQYVIIWTAKAAHARHRATP
jgi:cardiolipin synthase